MDNIFIVGAGAIGKALAVFLTLQNRSVVLLRGSVDSLEANEETIEVVLADGTSVTSTVSTDSFRNYKKLEGTIVLTNKVFGNAEIASKLRGKAGHSPIVLLQNGLAIEEPFLEEFASVYRGVLFATSQVISPHKVRFKPVSVSPVGISKGNRSELDKVVQRIDSVNFRFQSSAAIQEIVWRKVIANCVFNSICPLLDIDNGVFHRSAEALAIAKVVIGECIAIAKEEGIVLREQEIIDTVLLISKSSDGQLISTLQDIRNGRQTEIESLNFAIVKIADKLNLRHLVASTHLLGQMIRLKSASGRT